MTILMPKEKHVKDLVQHIMLDYTNATSIACIYVDLQGRAQSAEYNFTKFCHFMRSIPVFRNKCYQCDLYGGVESFKNNTCLPYRCHAGLVDFSAPIVYDSQLYGFIASGQMLSDDARIPNLPLTTSWYSDPQAFKYFQNLSKYRYEEIMSTARVLHTLTSCYFPYAHPIGIFSNKEKVIGHGFESILNSEDITRPEIRKAIQYIKDHLSCNLSLTTIANEVSLSDSYLSKVFKKEMDISLMQYINQCRVWEAEKLLISSPYSIEFISRRIGYSSASYFCKIFKQYTGETPYGYRRKYTVYHAK